MGLIGWVLLAIKPCYKVGYSTTRVACYFAFIICVYGNPHKNTTLYNLTTFDLCLNLILVNVVLQAGKFGPERSILRLAGHILWALVFPWL